MAPAYIVNLLQERTLMSKLSLSGGNQAQSSILVALPRMRQSVSVPRSGRKDALVRSLSLSAVNLGSTARNDCVVPCRTW